MICRNAVGSGVIVVLVSLLSYGQPRQAALELDVTELGLRARSEVIKILGKPTKSQSLGEDNYPWGFAAYTEGKLDQIDYEFKTRASSVKEALAKVGLEQTSEPRKGPLSYFWNDLTGPLICCGFEMDNVVVPADFAGISVGFKRRLTTSPPKSTSPGK